MSVEKMKRRVLMARSRVLNIEPEYKKIKEEYEDAVNEWKVAAKAIEDYDYLQAQIDGRTKKYPFGQKKPKPLTLSQVYEVAKRLGIDLNKA